MKSEFASNESFLRLREQAERLLAEKGSGRPVVEKDRFLHLVHELEVYQVELELQNQELRAAKADLESSREEFFRLYESAPVAYVTLNQKGLVERVNDAAAQLFSVYRPIGAGSNLLDWIYPEDIPLYSSMLAGLAVRGVSDPLDLRLKNERGKPVFTHVEASTSAVRERKNRHWQLAFVDITALKHAEWELKRLNRELEQRVRDRTLELRKRMEQLSRLSSRLTLAEQGERERIAGVLHDHVQQLMVGAKMGQELLIPSLEEGQMREAAHVLDLINQSIRATRSLSAELSPPILQSGDLAAAFQWLARWMQENHAFEVVMKIGPGRIPYQKDLTVLVYQSVRELLFNAVKHAGVKSAILELERMDKVLRVSVSDQGTGFDPETTSEKDYYGRKLGLPSIRERMRHLGGRFEIESAPETGTTVAMIIPLERAEYVEEGKGKTIQERPEKPVQPQARTRPSDGKIRVLLADDHPVILDGLSKMLGPKADIELVGEAPDGEKAVELAREIVPDVILMDINMPKMNGIEATRIIHSEFPHIRIIALSAYDEHELAAAMLDAGASAYRSKTENRELLLDAIRGEEKQSSYPDIQV